MPKSAAYKTNVYTNRVADFPNQYIALFDGNPTTGGTDLQDKLTGDFVLIEIGDQSIDAGKLQNDDEIELTASATDAGTADFVAIYSQNASSDNDFLIDFAALSPAVSWVAGQRVVIAPTNLKINET